VTRQHAGHSPTSDYNDNIAFLSQPKAISVSPVSRFVHCMLCKLRTEPEYYSIAAKTKTDPSSRCCSNWSPFNPSILCCQPLNHAISPCEALCSFHLQNKNIHAPFYVLSHTNYSVDFCVQSSMPWSWHWTCLSAVPLSGRGPSLEES